MQEIEFVYDFGSPNAYLVHRVLPALAARHRASVRPSPVLLGGVFKATNNQSPMEAFSRVRHKLTYQALELQRFVRRHGLVFHMNPHFPVNTLLPMRGAIPEACSTASSKRALNAWVSSGITTFSIS